MSGPRHLWSGDWERESADAERHRPEALPPAQTTDETELVETTSERRRRVRMLAIGTITAIVVVVVGVVLAEALGGSSKPRPRPIASVPTATTPAANPGLPRTRTNPNGGAGLGQATGTQTTPGTQTAPGSQAGQGSPGGTQTSPGSITPPATSPPAQQPTFTNQPTVSWLGMQIVTSPTGAVVNTVQIGSEGDTAGFEPGDMIAAVDGTQIDSARQIRAALANVRVGGRVDVEIARGSTLINMAVTMRGRPTLQP